MKEMANLYIQAAQVPKGPFLGVVTKMIVEEAGLHELTDALEAEVAFMAQQQKAQQEAQAQQAELAAGTEATKLQLEAQKVVNEQKKNEGQNQVELLKIIKELQISVAELQAAQDERDNAPRE